MGFLSFVEEKEYIQSIKNNKSQSSREAILIAVQRVYSTQEESEIFVAATDDAGRRFRHSVVFFLFCGRWHLWFADSYLSSFSFFQIEKFREIITRESGV